MIRRVATNALLNKDKFQGQVTGWQSQSDGKIQTEIVTAAPGFHLWDIVAHSNWGQGLLGYLYDIGKETKTILRSVKLG